MAGIVVGRPRTIRYATANPSARSPAPGEEQEAQLGIGQRAQGAEPDREPPDPAEEVHGVELPHLEPPGAGARLVGDHRQAGGKDRPAGNAEPQVDGRKEPRVAGDRGRGQEKGGGGHSREQHGTR